MYVATVVGKLWSTQKDATLEGLRFLVVRPYVLPNDEAAATLVAADTIGADIGERVLVVAGRAARFAIGRGHDVGCQTAIVGIIDRMELEGGRTVGPHTEWDE